MELESVVHETARARRKRRVDRKDHIAAFLMPVGERSVDGIEPCAAPVERNGKIGADLELFRYFHLQIGIIVGGRDAIDQLAAYIVLVYGRIAVEWARLDTG